MEKSLVLDITAIIMSLLSFGVALFALKISARKYDLQLEHNEIQKKEFEEKYKIQLHIKDEQFLTSHTFGLNKPKYYVEHPENIEFEYRAKYINRGNAIINIESLILAINAIEVKEMSFGCGENILSATHLAPGEEIEIKHRLKKENLDKFKQYIDEVSEKRGILEFSVTCLFSRLNGSKKEHKRILYRMSESGGDVSCKGYNAGKGIDKYSSIYEVHT